MDPHEALTEDDETCDMLDGIWGEVMELNVVHIEKCTKERMER